MNTKLSFSEKKVFYFTLFTIAIPIVIQNLIGNSLNMIDTLMISTLGENAIAAVGISNKLHFLFMLVTFGFYSGAGIFIAQYNGINDVKHIKSTVSLIVFLGLLISFIFTFIALFTPRFYLSFFTSDPDVMNLGVIYLRIIGLSYSINGMAYAYVVSYRSIGKSIYPMFVSAFSLMVNTFLNYGFINGYMGFPRLEIAGAAIATLIARIVEFALIVLSVYVINKNCSIAANIRDLRSIPEGFVNKYFKTALPVILSESFWGLGTVVYSVAYSKLGTTAIASTQVATTINDFFMVLAMGTANGAAVMLGNQLGQDHIETAKLYAKKFAVISFSVGLFTSSLLVLSLPAVNWAYGSDPILANNIRLILITKAIAGPFMTFNWCNIVGILRAGGDTKYAMMLELGTVWLIGVPMAFLGAAYFKFPVYIVSIMISCEEIVKALFGVPRVLSYKWAKNLTR